MSNIPISGPHCQNQEWVFFNDVFLLYDLQTTSRHS